MRPSLTPLPPAMAQISTEFLLPNGVKMKNRLSKAAMTEHMADPSTNLPNDMHLEAYKAWSDGGLGMNISGNVQVDRRYLEAPRNVSLEKDTPLEMFQKWAACSKRDGCLAIMQISHAGRQCPSSVCSEPLCPSRIPLKVPGVPSFLASFMVRTPREMTIAEIEEVVERFATTAQRAEEAGWDGVQIHSAHGYLLSSFLSPHTNRRTDAYGGSLENRRSLLLKIVETIRSRVSSSFVVMVKLNSADFQRGGFSEEESLQVLKALEDTKSIDMVEISGGTYEKMEAMQTVKESTRQREAFFLDFAKKARDSTSIPLMLTGGFSSVTAMNEALSIGAVDVIGLARPLCTEACGPRMLLQGELDTLKRHAPVIGIRYIDNSLGAALNNLWHGAHIHNLGKGLPVKPGKLNPSLWKMILLDMTFVYVWDPKRNPSKTRCLLALLCFAVLAATGGILAGILAR